jgi:hypothetical protein
MGRKLEGNGLWESNRMMLPQHKEALNNYDREKPKRTKPVLDEQELELISAAISESYTEGVELTLILYGEYKDEEVTGIVVGVDQQLGRVKLKIDDDLEDKKIQDVIRVR